MQTTMNLNTSVMPFIIRGIKLWGMDSANCIVLKEENFIWKKLQN